MGFTAEILRNIVETQRFEDEHLTYHNDVNLSFDMDHSIEERMLVLRNKVDGSLYGIEYAKSYEGFYFDSFVAYPVEEKELKVTYYDYLNG